MAEQTKVGIVMSFDVFLPGKVTEAEAKKIATQRIFNEYMRLPGNKLFGMELDSIAAVEVGLNE